MKKSTLSHISFMTVLLSFITMLNSLNCDAQNISNLSNGVYAGAGTYSTAKSGDILNQGTLLTLNYSYFSYNNFGVRGGIDYVRDIEDGIDLIFVPLNLAWHTKRDRRDLSERFGNAMSSYIDEDNTILGSILTMLPIQFELSAGLSPGYIYGDNYICDVWSSTHGEYTESVIIKQRFCMTANAGIALYLNIWRFSIMGRVQYHYMITDNFRIESTIKNSNPTSARSFCSLNLGLGLSF